jgi:putative Holliday junction resolvase
VTRALGIDLGDRRIGVAIGDDETGMASGLVTIRRASLEHDAEVITRLCQEQRATELVVGLPLHLDGSEGTQAAITREWGEAIAARLGMPVHWRDERLTSVAAESAVGRMRRSSDGAPPTRRTRERHRAAVDRDAARRILQAELDARAGVTTAAGAISHAATGTTR